MPRRRRRTPAAASATRCPDRDRPASRNDRTTTTPRDEPDARARAPTTPAHLTSLLHRRTGREGESILRYRAIDRGDPDGGGDEQGDGSEEGSEEKAAQDSGGEARG